MEGQGIKISSCYRVRRRCYNEIKRLSYLLMRRKEKIRIGSLRFDVRERLVRTIMT